MIKTEVKGVVVKIGQDNKVTDSFSKRRLLINTGDEYKPELCIEFFNQKAQLLDDLAEGERVNVHVNVFTNKSSKGQYFASITGWKIDVEKTVENNELVFHDEGGQLEESDDLPF